MFLLLYNIDLSTLTCRLLPHVLMQLWIYETALQALCLVVHTTVTDS